MKKGIAFLLSLLLLLTFVACGKSETPDQNDNQTPGETETCTVSFQDAGIADQTVEKGSTLQQPADPKKENQIFGGWYIDASFTTPAAFPITVDRNTTLYARFYDYQSAFRSAREKTIGETVSGYEYDYTTTATVAYLSDFDVSIAGNTIGNAKYSNSGDVSFYDEHTDSGLLFYDKSGYQIRRGNQLQKISLDENGLLINYEVEEVGNDYRFDASSFAKAIFEYDDSQLKSIEATSKANEYKLKTSFNASAGIAMASTLLNNETVKSKIASIPENQVDTGMYVTFSNGELLSYRYEMKISVTSLQFTLIYSLTFKNVGMAQTIVPRVFDNLSLAPDEITAVKSEINAYVSAFEEQASSGYDFTVNTGVDFPFKNEINSTFKGSAQRKTIDGVVYFHNDIEIDSNYKNADLYKSAGIDDIHIKRTRLANGDVYNIEKKHFVDGTTQLSPYTANRTDSYYLFDLLAQIGDYTFVQKTIQAGTTTYSIGVAKADVAKLLTYLNSQLDLDPLGKATADPLVFGEFSGSSVAANEIHLTVVIEGGALSSITLKADGEMRTALPDSRDFSTAKTSEFDFSYTLTVRSDSGSFAPYETVNKAKLKSF